LTKFRFTLRCCLCDTYVLLTERRLPEGWTFQQAVSSEFCCVLHPDPHQPIFCPDHGRPSHLIHDEGEEPEEEDRPLQKGDAVYFRDPTGRHVPSTHWQPGVYEGPHPDQPGWFWVTSRETQKLVMVSARSIQR